MAEILLPPCFGHTASVDQVWACGEFSKKMPPMHLPWRFFQMYGFPGGIRKIEEERLRPAQNFEETEFLTIFIQRILDIEGFDGPAFAK